MMWYRESSFSSFFCIHLSSGSTNFLFPIRLLLSKISRCCICVFISGLSVLLAWSAIPAPIGCDRGSWSFTLQVWSEILWVLEVCSFIIVMAILGSVNFHTDFITDLLVFKTLPKSFLEIWLGLHWFHRSLEGNSTTVISYS